MGLPNDQVPHEAALSAYVDAVIAFEDLPIAPEWRSSVADHFEAITAAARLVLSFPLDDLIDAAPIFEA